MAKIRCWMMDQPGTEHVVEVDDPVYVADFYSKEHNRCEAGDINFIETELGDLWRVECVNGRPLIVLMVVRITKAEAECEIAESLEAI